MACRRRDASGARRRCAGRSAPHLPGRSPRGEQCQGLDHDVRLREVAADEGYGRMPDLFSLYLRSTRRRARRTSLLLQTRRAAAGRRAFRSVAPYASLSILSARLGSAMSLRFQPFGSLKRVPSSGLSLCARSNFPGSCADGSAASTVIGGGGTVRSQVDFGGLQLVCFRTPVRRFRPSVHRTGWKHLTACRCEKGDIDPRVVITHRLGLSQAPMAYKNFKDNQDEFRKVVLKL